MNPDQPGRLKHIPFLTGRAEAEFFTEGTYRGGAVMIKTGFLWRTLLTSLVLVAYMGCSSGTKEAGVEACVDPKVVADYVHAIIEADRTLYASLVVERMKHHGKDLVVEDWAEKDKLPLPAQMLQFAGLEVERKGSGLKYRLASLWPIDKTNKPANDLERTGLQAVSDDPGIVHTRTIKRPTGSVFKAIYADRAVSDACVTCHNEHPLSPRTNYKPNDVMGGIIIQFPLK
ncbi:MAG: hypothetical protein NPIRA05_03640 [Nitrospirales bacterium]|nr:MAG: hypothetical protein NPIRA05_03640 [Nitrospirales bacterium]